MRQLCCAARPQHGDRDGFLTSGFGAHNRGRPGDLAASQQGMMGRLGVVGSFDSLQRALWLATCSCGIFALGADVLHDCSTN